MSGFTAELFRVFFAGDDATYIDLTFEGKPLDGGGYQRALVARGDWIVQGQTARALVLFGPFEVERRFDAARVSGPGGWSIELPFASPAVVPSGMGYQYEAVLEGVTVGG